MQFNFNKQTVLRVKDNWLYRENSAEFIQAKTDSDICLTFARVSNMTGNETGLAFEISYQVVKQMISK